MMTLFRPSTGILTVKGVLSVTNTVLHPWLKEELSAMLATIEKAHPREELPPEGEHPLYAQWITYLPPHENATGLPPLRIILVLDNLAGHLTRPWLSGSSTTASCPFTRPSAARG